jgi:DNA-binding transcriptional LysR family regulator
MSITRYKYFEKVARLGTIREAAEALHVAPSAVSRQIAQLEYENDIALFERHARGMNLTSAGEILFAHARGLLDHHESARSEISDLKGLRRGEVRVWTIEGMVKDFVVPIIADFQEQYPGILISLEVASTDLITNALMSDDADIGILFNPQSLRGLAVAASVNDPLHVVVSPSHPAAALDKIRIEDLPNWRIALADETFGIRHILDQVTVELNVEIIPSLLTNSIEALRSYARSAKGIAILTPLSVRQDVQLGLLKAIPVVLPDHHTSSLKICTRKDRTNAMATQKLLDTLSGAFEHIAP